MIANAGIARLSPLIESEYSVFVIEIKQQRRHFFSASVEELESVLAVNVRGVFLCYKHAAIQMIEEGHGGRIIGMTYRPFPYHSTVAQKVFRCLVARRERRCAQKSHHAA